MNKLIEAKPLQKMSLGRKILSFLPYHCSYCGKMYVPCHSKSMSILNPMLANGKFCPNGHEGYVIQYEMWGGASKYTFDFVKEPQLKEIVD